MRIFRRCENVARVEWIQNVRRETSDLLTAINNYIYSDENDVDLVKMNLMSVREKSNLLILYFGPDKVENDKVDLLNKGDNISKNQHHGQSVRGYSWNHIDSYHG